MGFRRVDHMNFDFEVDPANVMLATQGSKILAAQAAINPARGCRCRCYQAVFSAPPSLPLPAWMLT